MPAARKGHRTGLPIPTRRGDPPGDPQLHTRAACVLSEYPRNRSVLDHQLDPTLAFFRKVLNSGLRALSPSSGTRSSITLHHSICSNRSVSGFLSKAFLRSPGRGPVVNESLTDDQRLLACIVGSRTGCVMRGSLRPKCFNIPDRTMVCWKSWRFTCLRGWVRDLISYTVLHEYCSQGSQARNIQVC
jgi:hypothetical protein